MRKISEILAEAKKRATPNADFVKSLRQKHIVPSIDRERYTDIPGMEGPFRAKKSGHIVYYDPKKGLYYDRDSDMYLDHDEAQARGLYEQFELDESATKPAKPGHNQKVLNKNINKLLKVIKDRTPKEPENK